MQKNSYYPSPLRRDYLSKPVRNFNPIIITQSSRQGTARDQNSQLQKIIRFEDGLLVKLYSSPINKIQSGLFFFNNHSCLIYKTAQGKPDGINYIIYPSGILMSINYENGFINKWLIAIFNDKFIICYQYKKGIKQGQQYFYDIDDKLLVISQYKKGKLSQINNGTIGQFAKLIKNEQITQRVQELKSKNFSIHKKFPSINTSQYNYYGQLNQNYIPNGLGIMLVGKQIYSGHFNNGFLNGLGYIKYEDNSLYFGNFQHGMYHGYGSIKTKNDKITYKFEHQIISKKQFQEYLGMVMVIDLQNILWSNKYSDIYQFNQQFTNNKYLKDLKYLKSQTISSVDINIIENDSKYSLKQYNQKELQDHEQDFYQQNKSQNYSFTKSKNKNIPKLSLFQKLHQKQKNISQYENTDRQNQFTLKNTRKKSLTDRAPQITIIQQQNYLKVPIKNQNSQKKSVTQAKIQKQKQERKQEKKQGKTNSKKSEISSIKNNSFNLSGRQQHLGTQMIDSSHNNYVNMQSTHLRPNFSETKRNIDRNVAPRLTKNEGNVKVDLSKIIRTESQVSDANQAQFIKRIFK